MPQEIKRKKKKKRKRKKANVHPTKQITLSPSVFSPFWRENSWVPSHFFLLPFPTKHPPKSFPFSFSFSFSFFLIIIFFHPL